MTRLNMILLAALIGCALSVVTSQHKARKFFMELQSLQDGERKLDQEWRELQIESQTLGTGKFIEQKASRDLAMTVPDAKKTVILTIDTTAEISADGAVDNKAINAKAAGAGAGK